MLSLDIDMRHCSTCAQDLDDDRFYRRGPGSGTRAGYFLAICKDCRRARSARIYIETDGVTDKAAYRRKREVLDKAKDIPCMRCGATHPPYVMDFHHRDPSNKSFSIGVNCGSKGLDALVAEIAKCDVLCANCHRYTEHEG
jgi:hypothetical protein